MSDSVSASGGSAPPSTTVVSFAGQKSAHHDDLDGGSDGNPVEKKKRRRKLTSSASSPRLTAIMESTLTDHAERLVSLMDMEGVPPWGTRTKAHKKYLQDAKADRTLTLSQFNYRADELFQQQMKSSGNNDVADMEVNEGGVIKKIGSTTQKSSSPPIVGNYGTINLLGGEEVDESTLEECDFEMLIEKDVLSTGVEQQLSVDDERRAKIGGRPKMIEEDKADKAKYGNEVHKAKCNQCKNAIVEEFFSDGNTKPQSQLIKEHEKAHNLAPGTIPADTISRRITASRNAGFVKVVNKPGPKGAIEGQVEDSLVQYLLRLADFGFPANFREIRAIANSFIKETEVEKDIKKKKKDEVNGDDDGDALGTRWLQLFLNRHERLLKVGYPQLFDSERKEWTTYDNFERMFDRLEKALLLCKIAVRLTKHLFLIV
jgi:hypothetical protein